MDKREKDCHCLQLQENVDQCAKRYAPDIYEKLASMGEINVHREHIKRSIQTLETLSFEEIKQHMQVMIRDIENNSLILRERVKEVLQLSEKESPCIDKYLPYFDYPAEKFIEPFKQEINNCLRQGRIPDIGIIGYGSLQSSSSANVTMHYPYKREPVSTYDLQRGFFLRHYSTHATRKDAFWAKTGATRYDETGSMAVRYKEGQLMNGVRLSKLSLQDIQNLSKREFPYFLLPCGHSYNNFGERNDLNLICWPIGNHLTQTVKADKWEHFISNPIFQREGEDDDDLYDMHMFRCTHALYYNGLKPDIHYVETCLNRGNSEQENLFLDTTFVPMPEGEPILLREYLAQHAPANDETKREYFGPRLKKRQYRWDEKENRWILKKEISIKTTQRSLR